LSAAVLLAAVCLAGCGGSETTTTPSTPKVATVAHPAITSAPGANPATSTGTARAPTSTAPASGQTNTARSAETQAHPAHPSTTGTPPPTVVPDRRSPTNPLARLHLQGRHPGAALGLLGVCSPKHSTRLSPATRERLKKVCTELEEAEKATKAGKGRRNPLGL
jgi:hypothetical protein